MKLDRPLRILACLLAFAGSATAAWAQASCERYKAELASLNRSGAAARSYETAASRHRDEIARLSNYYRSIGCDRAFFFMQPAECGPIAQRIRALQANYSAVAGQAVADPSALEARRQQLQAAIARTCDPNSADEVADTVPAPTGGSRIVCVRSCDGFFFPLQNEPEGRATPADLCKALCPNAEVSVYRAPRDGGIEQAVSETGKPYMKLANALRYTKTTDPSCSCRKAGDSWAETLQKAEKMIAHKSSDIVVTAAIAERMSQARMSAPKVKRGKDKEPEKPTEEVASTGSVPDVETTASKESAGITSDAGEVPEDKGSKTGTAVQPRIIAPHLIPVPQMDRAGAPAKSGP
jgi:hypothetical protein